MNFPPVMGGGGEARGEGEEERVGRRGRRGDGEGRLSLAVPDAKKRSQGNRRGKKFWVFCRSRQHFDGCCVRSHRTIVLTKLVLYDFSSHMVGSSYCEERCLGKPAHFTFSKSATQFMKLYCIFVEFVFLTVKVFIYLLKFAFKRE